MLFHKGAFFILEENCFMLFLGSGLLLGFWALEGLFWGLAVQVLGPFTAGCARGFRIWKSGLVVSCP